MQPCNKCKQNKELDQFRVVNDKLNHNARMQVCIDCVTNNKLRYLKHKATELALLHSRINQ